MKEITNEEFATAMTAADARIKTLMGSSELLDVLEKKLEESASSVSADDLLMPFGYYFLNLYAMEELLAILTEYQMPNAQAFITSIESTIRAGGSADAVAANEIAEMEAVLQSIPPVRTMATDMQLVREQGSGEYSSNQDALLKRDIPKPPPSDPEEARWNSTDHY